MMKNDEHVLKPIDDVMMTAAQIGERWAEVNPRIAVARLKAGGARQYRLGSRTIRYKLSDVLRIEEEAASRTMADYRKKPNTGAFKKKAEVGNA
jgi:DNA-binding transcriptional regulator PaaX